MVIYQLKQLLTFAVLALRSLPTDNLVKHVSCKLAIDLSCPVFIFCSKWKIIAIEHDDIKWSMFAF